MTGIYTNIKSPEERYYWKETQIRKNGKPSEGFCVILPLWIKKKSHKKINKRKHCPYTPNTQYWPVLVSGSTAVHCPVCEAFLPGQWGTGSQHPLVNVTWSPGRQQQWLFWSVWQHTGERKEVIGKQQWESHKNKTGKQKYHECSLKQTLSERFTLTQADWSLSMQ